MGMGGPTRRHQEEGSAECLGDPSTRATPGPGLRDFHFTTAGPSKADRLGDAAQIHRERMRPVQGGDGSCERVFLQSPGSTGTLYIRLDLNSQRSTCCCLLNAGTKGMC
ncbi:foxo1-corepressor [Mus caroli]|uniref:Foxo1-corepressor n=1 Tax=Mus caroli TaxID=10089 RepID=A0A6P7RGH6_MUSCR|nr:foxo1-corepressor [Mus caroli]